MVIDIFKGLLESKRNDLRELSVMHTQEFIESEYKRFRQSMLDIIRELYLGCPLDFDELNSIGESYY